MLQICTVAMSAIVNTKEMFYAEFLNVFDICFRTQFHVLNLCDITDTPTAKYISCDSHVDLHFTKMPLIKVAYIFQRTFR
jgi:hypothetical protein